jgi:hypothetical protein
VLLVRTPGLSCTEQDATNLGRGVLAYFLLQANCVGIVAALQLHRAYWGATCPCFVRVLCTKACKRLESGREQKCGIPFVYNGVSRIRFHAFAAFVALYMAHNPKVVSSNLTPATNF